MAGSITDISERKRAEREVVESRDLLRLVTDNLPALIVYLDADLRYRLANETTAEWHARPVEEIIGKSAPELLGQEYEKLRPRIDRVFAGEQLTYIENVTYPDGVTRTVRGNYVPHFGEAGSVEGCFSLVEDITESVEAELALREHQERLRLLLETTPAIPWEADAKSWIFTYVGPQAVELLGYPRERWLEKDFWVEHIHPEDRARVVDYCLTASNRDETYEFEYRMIAADGRNVWLHDIVNVVKEDSTPVALRGFMIDITERKQAEAALHDVGIRLISSQEEERSRIARELHDDFGQRLALISVKLEQLQDGWPGTRDSFVSDTTPLVQAVKELSSDIHRMSHQLHPSILQHLGLLTAIESFCKEISSQHDIRINFVHHGVPHTLSSEVKLCLYRIVQEALRNVVKHANAERVQVEITGAEGELSLQISDNGTGFDPQSAQAHKGLGLLSMRERLRLVNGRVSFRQAEPTGTRIDVRVPF